MIISIQIEGRVGQEQLNQAIKVKQKSMRKGEIKHANYHD